MVTFPSYTAVASFLNPTVRLDEEEAFRVM